MIQVKEFIGYGERLAESMNKWLKKNKEDIKIIDIKYSIATFPTDSYYPEPETSGALIIYEVEEDLC